MMPDLARSCSMMKQMTPYGTHSARSSKLLPSNPIPNRLGRSTSIKRGNRQVMAQTRRATMAATPRSLFSSRKLRNAASSLAPADL
jgi:hypothetical protein